MNETRVWRRLYNYQQAQFPNGHMRRVENLAGTGDADVNGCIEGQYFDVELKVGVRRLLSKKIALAIRRSQVPWHTKRSLAGGNNWFLIYIAGPKAAENPVFYMVPGTYNTAKELMDGVAEERLQALNKNEALTIEGVFEVLLP